MTTIIYHKGQLATDSQITDRDCRIGHTKKIHPFPGGYLAVAGYADTRPFIALFDEVDDPDSMPTHAELKAVTNRYAAIVVFEKPHARVFLVDAGYDDDDPKDKNVGVFEIMDDSTPIVVGSGGAWAQGALRAGASISEAIDIASEFDMATGGPVQEVTVFKSKATTPRK